VIANSGRQALSQGASTGNFPHEMFATQKISAGCHPGGKPRTFLLCEKKDE